MKVNYDSDKIESICELIYKTNPAAILSCSDGVTIHALQASEYCGLTSGTNFEAFQSKAASYKLFSEAGFATLPFKQILTLEDIEECDIQGEIFVKPDWSSAVYGQVPWAYKRFVSTKHLLDYIVNSGLRDRFLTASANPFERSIVMPFIAHDGITTISGILRKDRAVPLAHSFVKISGDDYFYDYLNFADIGDTKKLNPCISRLWDLGFHSHFTYLQCLNLGGVNYCMDANTRMSTYLDTWVTRHDPSFYERCLAFVLQESNAVNFETPSPHTMIARVRCDPHLPIKSLTWKDVAGVEPLNFNSLSTSRAPYDKAYSWPTFVVTADSQEQLLVRYERFLQGVCVTQ